MGLNSEQELVFAKVLVERKMAPADAVKECLRAQSTLLDQGRAVPLRLVLAERGVLGREELDAFQADFERRVGTCEACGAYHYVAEDEPPRTLCRRCSGLAARSVKAGSAPVETTARFRAARERAPSAPSNKEGAPTPTPSAKARASGPRPASPPAPPPAPGATPASGATPGESFGEYEIVETVARGGMGIVFKARHKTLKRIVALKVLREGRRSSDDHVRRFKREAQSVAKLQHPNIVRIHEFGFESGQYFFTMDFVEGEPLEAYLARPERDLRRGIEIVRETARAMDFAHKNGVVHRDIKPANILLEKDGKPRITDFGLARNVDQNSSLTQEGELLGTPLYMSPEQVRGRVKEVDARSDVYALGVILYQHLTGQLPFIAQTMVDLQWKVVNEEPANIRELSPLVDQALETIVLKCLEKSRDDRYQTAEDLASDLDRWLGGERIQARAISTHGRILRQLRRNRMAVISLAIALPLLLIGSAIVAWAEWNTHGERARLAHEDAVRGVDHDTGDLLRASEAQLDAARSQLAAGQTADAEKSLAAARARAADLDAVPARGLAPAEVATIRERREVARLKPELLRMAIRIERAHAGADALERARLLLLDLTAIPAGSPGQTPRDLAGAHVILAGVFRERALAALRDAERAQAGLTEAERALAALPRYQPALRIQGDMLHLLHRLPEAEAAFSAALAPDAILAQPDVDWAAGGREESDLDTPSILVARAQVRAERGRDADALGDLRDAIAAKPTDPLAYIIRGDIESRTREHVQAARDYDRAIELSGDRGDAYLHRGRLFLREGDYLRASNDFQLAIAVQDTLWEAYYESGVAFYYLGDDARAESDLLRVAEEKTADRATVGDAWRALGRLRRAMRRPEDAITAYERAASIDVIPGDAITGIGFAQLDLGRAQAAEATFLRATEVGAVEQGERWVGAGLAALATCAPLSPTATSGPAARAAARRALDDFDHAPSGMSNSGELAWHDPAVISARAEAKERLGDRDAATQGFLAAYRAAETAPDVRWFLRQAKKLQGLAARAEVELDRATKQDQALKLFDRVTALSPRCAHAHVERARMFLAARRTADAIAECDAAIAANRCALDAWMIRGRFEAQQDPRSGGDAGGGPPRSGGNDMARAIADLSTAIELGAGDAGVRYWRGVALLKRGETARAVADLEAAAALAPGDKAVFGQLQTVYVKLNDLAKADAAKARYADLQDEAKAKAARELAVRGDQIYKSDPRGAIEAYGKAIVLAPDDGTLYLRRALVYLNGVDRAHAVPDFARAVELRPALAGKLYESLGPMTQLFDAKKFIEQSGGGTQASSSFLRGFVYVLEVESNQFAPGDPERGIEELTRALDESPTSAAAYCFRGLLDLRVGDLRSAKEDLGVALSLEGACAAARVYMAGVCAQEGNFDLAFAYLTQAIQDGFTDWPQLARDAALQPLKLDRRWREIMKSN